jgi:DNA polymerase I-like protein with 3'-5' exonuclease and polymerase domains/uracil-DNA glycosylase
MSYDPRELGADCDRCPLRNSRAGGPVPTEWGQRPIALIVGANPGLEEIKAGAPFVGKAGLELMRGLTAIGIQRRQVALANAIECAPPGVARGALERFLHELQKTNKRRERDGLEKIPTPAECCRPRLLKQIGQLPKVVTVGATPISSILRHPVKIMEARGGPREVTLDVGEPGAPSLQPVKILPTLHPSFILSSRRWVQAFRADLARAFRWFTSGLAWKDPTVLYRPSPSQLREWLRWARSLPYTSADFETFAGFPAQEHFDPLYDQPKCLGIGEPGGQVVLIPFKSIEGAPSFYSQADKNEIIALILDYFTNPAFLKVGWNFGYYDRMVAEERFKVTPRPVLDGIGLHRMAEPELPHGLAYAGSIHTDVHSWKAGHIATTAATDVELWKYCAIDTVVAAQSIPPLKRACDARGQTHLVKTWAKLQDICVGLHRNGLPVDQIVRRAWDRKLLWKARVDRSRCQQISGLPKLNPGSFPQVADLLFNRWGIAPHGYTDLGEPSTNDDGLRAFLSATWDLPPVQKSFIQALREYRRTTKRRSVVVRLRPISEEYFEEPLLIDLEETPEEKEENEKRARKGKPPRACGLVLPDGRVHSDFNAHGSIGWRISSSNPNVQNLESRLRDMFVAPEGYVFVGCDEAQLELRMVAALAKAPVYLEAFRKKEDPHRVLCLDFFGDTFVNADKDQKSILRRFCKNFTYGSSYGAGEETVHELLTASEDENEKLLFPSLTIRETGAFHDKWLRRNPEIAAWWEAVIEEWRKQGYLQEPVLGLRVDFLDGEDRNRLINFKAQSGGSALVHLATFRILEKIPFYKWGKGTGLVHQGHDSLVMLVPAEHGAEGPDGKWCRPGCRCAAAETGRIMEEGMSEDARKYGLDVSFHGEMKISNTLKGA